MQTLELELKKLIIDVLNLEDLTPDDIDSNAPLFGDELGLDSIDALELGVTIKKHYNLSLDADDKSTHKHFESVASLAKFISENKKD
ncbi:phosphopantetheine-binding protein [Facilibium subflavum]|uniref:phosphopantetheine-binding protein n=1 Tax=Facilibium subflavum TaxID=2219058 RepID=UPI000E656756|nr:phosphopantetheine-binding protein [Facilibium subflavum]